MLPLMKGLGEMLSPAEGLGTMLAQVKVQAIETSLTLGLWRDTERKQVIEQNRAGPSRTGAGSGI